MHHGVGDTETLQPQLRALVRAVEPAVVVQSTVRKQRVRTPSDPLVHGSARPRMSRGREAVIAIARTKRQSFSGH